MQNKFLKTLLFLALSLLLISCQSDPGKKKAESPKEGQKKEQTHQQSKQENKQTGNEQGSDFKLADSSKEIVYPLDNEHTQKMIDYSFIEELEPGKKTEVKQKVMMRFPQVNLESADAESFNRSMQTFAKFEFERYQYETSEKYYWTHSLDYKFFRNDEILSILIYHFNSSIYQEPIDPEKDMIMNIKSVNFDLKTGKLLKDEEVLEMFGISDYEKRILGYIYDFGQNLRSDLDEQTDEEIRNILITEASFVIGSSNTNFWRSRYELEQRPDSIFFEEQGALEGKELWAIDDYDLQNVAPQFYFNADRKSLMAFVKLNVQADAGYYYQNMDLSDQKPKEFVLNPSYVYYAKKRGIDPEDPKSPIAFSALLGYRLDENAKHRLQSLKDNGGVNLEELITAVMYDYGEGEKYIGEELYVLIPKYFDTSISIAHISVTEEGEELISTFFTYCGNILLYCNPSELRTNCEVQFNIQDRLVKYHPSVSLKDGSNTVPDQIEDISDVVEKELVKVADEAYELLEKFLPKG